MNLLTRLFKSKDNTIRNNKDFWEWFVQNERTFFQVVKKHKSIENDFFNKLSPKLKELRDGFFYLTGMFDKDTAELILTPDGNIKNIVFTEELVSEAPNLIRWKFTALKPPMKIRDEGISMSGYKFNSDNLFFYSNDIVEYPDEIDISITHNDLISANRKDIIHGVYIFLDNYLGELDFVINIDNIDFISKNEAKKELIPISKLKDFLVWRQKEFIEKYEGVRNNTENDTYSIFEAKDENDNNLIASINTELLKWDKKASHPWILKISISFKGDERGMPDKNTSEVLYDLEDSMCSELKDFDGYLNVGRETTTNLREIYFACKEFRKPSKVIDHFIAQNDINFDIDFEIYKDKYWQTFNRYNVY